MSEEWRPIKNYEGFYEVSDIGNVKSLKRKVRGKDGRVYNIKEKILKPMTLGNYLGFQLSKNCETRKFYTHRLVCASFLGEPIDEKKTVNHKDGNKYNNELSNLEWSSYSENISHAYRNGLNKSSGENSHYSKFPDEIIKEVRKKYATGSYLQKDLADMYGISKMQIHRIVKYKNRKEYVEDEGYVG